MPAGWPTAGHLRHSLALQLPVKSRTPQGAVVKAWGTVATLPASVTPLGGTELRDARQVNGRTTHRIVVRYHAQVSTFARFVLEKPGQAPRYFHPTGPALNLEEKDVWLQMDAEERT